jgi:hypothetical protein
MVDHTNQAIDFLMTARDRRIKFDTPILVGIECDDDVTRKKYESRAQNFDGRLDKRRDD